MAEDAVAYERAEQADGLSFEKHIQDGAGYYQALRLFWRLLFPRKGSFTYVSHRVMKWIVWINMTVVFLTNAILICSSRLMLVMFVLQALLYLVMLLYWIFVEKRQNFITGIIRKVLSLVFYFVSLNVAFLFGCFRHTKEKKTTLSTMLNK